MRTKLFAGVAFAALIIPASAFAQSTGSVDFEGEEIVVTGARVNDVGGVELPDTSKAKVAIDAELIQRQMPGQTVNDIINLVPGVSFQNNDPWGSSGGTFTIRGFNDERISQTLDGIQLNDSGGYAIYTNQQIDPETIEQINVNLGTTDIDSPTGNAVGSTVNIRTRAPAEDFHVMLSGTYGNILARGSGDRPMMRVFGMVDTGDLTGMGTKMWMSASYSRAMSAFNNYSKTDKQQYNAKILQDIGSNGDFISISGHYNENRNNFMGSNFALADFPTTGEGRFYDLIGAGYPCTLPAARPGQADTYSDSTGPAGSCGAAFDRRYNPSNTGNIRINSRFTLADGLVLTVDPSYQYVKANGGGAEDLREQTRVIGGQAYTGFIGGAYYYGRDLNGDGDLLDRVGGIDPSQTQTHRYMVLSSLAYEINPDHRLRLAFTYDNARHRQTGETGLLQLNGEPFDVFPVNDPVLTVDGFAVNKRDRLSYAILTQLSGEYRGRFGGLTVSLGARAPWFTRKLNNYCYTTSASGFLDCLGPQDVTAYEAANPYSYDPATQTVTGSAPPQSRTLKYNRLLPNVGATYKFTPALSLFANYSKNMKVPGTDQLYDNFYYPITAEEANAQPETTDNFDLGLRYRSGKLQAQLSGWLTKFANRTAVSYDPILDEYITRNLGDVTRWGIDGSVSVEPVRNMLFYVFGSYLHSKIEDDVAGGRCTAAQAGAGSFGCTTAGDVYFLPTAGNYESGIPQWSLGARVQGSIGPVDLGAQVKHTGPRWVDDVNTLKVEGYTVVDLDIRYTLASVGLRDSYVQLNVSNLFDELYVGGFDGDLTSINPFVQIGPPRAASLSLVVGF